MKKNAPAFDPKAGAFFSNMAHSVCVTARLQYHFKQASKPAACTASITAE